MRNFLLIAMSLLAQRSFSQNAIVEKGRLMFAASEVDNIKEFKKNFELLEYYVGVKKDLSSLSDSALFYYMFGVYQAKDYFIAVDEKVYEKIKVIANTLAKKRDPDCNFFIGDEEDNDNVKALPYLLKATEGGHFKKYAFAKLADIYAEQKDTVKAIQFYKKAIQLGNDISNYELGSILLGKKDYNTAYYYLTQAKSKIINTVSLHKGVVLLLLGSLQLLDDKANTNYDPLSGRQHLKEAYAFQKDFFSYLVRYFVDDLSELFNYFKNDKHKLKLPDFMNSIRTSNALITLGIGNSYHYTKGYENVDSAVVYYRISYYNLPDSSAQAALELANIYNADQLYKPDSALKYFSIFYYSGEQFDFTIPETIGFHYSNEVYNYDSAIKFNRVAIAAGSKWANYNQANLFETGKVPDKYGMTPGIRKEQIADLYHDAFLKSAGDDDLKISAIIGFTRVVYNGSLTNKYNDAYTMLLNNKGANNKFIFYTLYLFYRDGLSIKENKKDAKKYLLKAKDLGKVLNDSDIEFLRKN